MALHTLWQKFRLFPELVDINTMKMHAEDTRYQLRPEMAESMFYLYNKTKDPLWLLLARDIIDSIQSIAKTKCGYASVDVSNHRRLDTMESFFLAETCKYLYLLYDPNNFLLKKNVVFSTEGHPFWLPISKQDQTIELKEEL